MSRRRIWIDTDPALHHREGGNPRDVDDAFAIVEAIADPRIDLVGLSPVFGNAPSDVGRRVADELVRLTGANVPVFDGAAGPGSAQAGFERTPAADAMAEALREAPLRIVAIGPLTNVASLLEHHPDVVGRIEEVVIVAGRSVGQVFELHGAAGIPDFNFESDPVAAERLLASGVRVALLGFELTSRVVLTRDDVASLRGRSRVADWIVDGTLPWLEWWTAAFPADGGFHPWDSAALAWVTRPELFVHEPRGWRIRPMPEGAPGAPGTPWLELGAELPGPRVTYCPDFVPGGAADFVREILARVP